MGGQACISYGAADFSRDVDLAIVSSLQNIHALRKAMASLQAEVIAVPPLNVNYLRKATRSISAVTIRQRKACASI